MPARWRICRSEAAFAFCSGQRLTRRKPLRKADFLRWILARPLDPARRSPLEASASRATRPYPRRRVASVTRLRILFLAVGLVTVIAIALFAWKIKDGQDLPGRAKKPAEVGPARSVFVAAAFGCYGSVSPQENGADVPKSPVSRVGCVEDPKLQLVPRGDFH